MIKYALVCANDHDFESWFPDSAAYEQQVKLGFVTCPVCDTTRVAKALMAPAVAVRREPAEGAELREKLRQWRALVEAGTEDVGRLFREQARQMHDGEIEHRPIRGQATLPEAQALVEDGVAICPVPTFPDEFN